MMSGLISIIIPVYNEADVLKQRIEVLTKALSIAGHYDYELIICNNGSFDDTLRVAARVEQTCHQLRTLTVPGPDYGRALKEGFRQAKGEYLVVFGIDRFDIGFLDKGLEMVESGNSDIVVGSKLMKDGSDNRSIDRRLISVTFSGIARLMFGYRGTDFHGLKVLRRDSVLKVLEKCHTRDVMFDTELLVLAQRYGLKIDELPVTVIEVRRSKYTIKRGLRVPFQLIALFIRLNISGDS